MLAPKDRQAAVLTALSVLTEKWGYPPSIREIMKFVGSNSTSHTRYILQRLEDQGRVRRRKSNAYSIGRGWVLAETAQPVVLGRYRGKPLVSDGYLVNREANTTAGVVPVLKVVE